MIHKLESAGLGYHVKSDESDDRLGMKLIVCNCFLTPWFSVQDYFAYFYPLGKL